MLPLGFCYVGIGNVPTTSMIGRNVCTAVLLDTLQLQPAHSHASILAHSLHRYPQSIHMHQWAPFCCDEIVQLPELPYPHNLCSKDKLAHSSCSHSSSSSAIMSQCCPQQGLANPLFTPDENTPLLLKATTLH